MPTTTPDEWESRYRTGDLPWDSQIVSAELKTVLREQGIPPCRTLELGCGTGTNAIYLASQRFRVVAVDVSPTALEQARAGAAEQQVVVDWMCRDLAKPPLNLEPFQFVFDRGCYHCARRNAFPEFRTILEEVTEPGTTYLSLSGNADEQTDTEGPPRVTEDEIRTDFGDLFDFIHIRPFRFEDAGGIPGPLGWSTLMVRKRTA